MPAAVKWGITPIQIAQRAGRACTTPPDHLPGPRPDDEPKVTTVVRFYGGNAARMDNRPNLQSVRPGFSYLHCRASFNAFHYIEGNYPEKSAPDTTARRKMAGPNGIRDWLIWNPGR